jgi:uncharacterized protein Smg (DUF494 family)
MSDDRRMDPVQRIFRLLADHLESWLEGDELALETLGQALQESGLDDEELQAALLALRGLAGPPLCGHAESGVTSLEEAPGLRAQRVPSPEERESLSPEAWGFLLALRQRGSLDSGQFERVLDRLAASGVRPIGVELAREVAVRVAWRGAGRASVLDGGAGDGELAH